MARGLREADARNSLVYVTDSRDGKNIRGFGIDKGPGLPEHTRLVAFGLYWDGAIQENIILVDERNPLVLNPENFF